MQLATGVGTKRWLVQKIGFGKAIINHDPIRENQLHDYCKMEMHRLNNSSLFISTKFNFFLHLEIF